MDIRTFFTSEKKGKRWTDEEVIQLLTLVRKKESHESIAKTLGRTPGAVHSHLKKLAAEYYENDAMSIETIQKMVGLSRSVIEEAIQKKTTKAIEKSHYAFYDTENGSSGVYPSWDDIRPHVSGQKGRLHKGFTCEEDAHLWIANQDPPSVPSVPTVYKEPSLSPEQKEAFDAIRAGESVFLTGPGGTGKTFLIDHIRNNLAGKTIAVTALTGCAALLLGSDAKTIFSWAGIGIGKDSREKYVDQLRMMKHLSKRWRETDILIIDEVSMMTPELLELLEYLGRTVRPTYRSSPSPLPFGGLQVVLVGDFLQLPPVEKGEQQFAFESPVWNQVVKRTIHLKRIYRQTDTAFQTILDEARTANLSAASYKILESRMNLPWKDELIKPTLLFTRRAAVDAINNNSLAKLTGETQTYKCKTLPVKCAPSEVAKIVEKMDRDANYVVDLSLKVGAQVMLLKNLEPELGLVNGSRGVVVSFQEFPPYLPKVQFKDCTRIIKPEIWASNHEPPIQREQIPLRLAYALTIHKAQGASLDSALVDIGDSTFEYGQAYVALSRVRSLEGLYVHDLSPAAFRAHPTVKAFYEGNYVRKAPTPPPTTIPELTFVEEEIDAPPVPSRSNLFGKK
jgi:ATP-dependent DNA helicase PIF1